MILRIGFWIAITAIFMLASSGKIKMDMAILISIYWLFCYEIFK